MVGKKWNQHHCRVGSMLLLNMALVYIRVGLETSHLIFHLLPWVWVIPFDLSSALCLVAMTSDLLMSNTAKLTVVPPYVQEKLTSASTNLPLILIWSWFTKTLCSSISCRWCGKHYGPPSIKITSCRHQLIIQEANLETPFWYLGAYMPQWQVLRIRREVFIFGLRSGDFAGVRRQLIIHMP